MPQILENLVSKLMKQGKTKESAYAIATASLQRSGYLKKGTNKATRKKPKLGE